MAEGSVTTTFEQPSTRLQSALNQASSLFIKGMAFHGPFAGGGIPFPGTVAALENHGIYIEGMVEAEDVWVEGFGGDGIHIEATSGVNVDLHNGSPSTAAGHHIGLYRMPAVGEQVTIQFNNDPVISYTVLAGDTAWDIAIALRHLIRAQYVPLNPTDPELASLDGAPRCRIKAAVAGQTYTVKIGPGAPVSVVAPSTGPAGINGTVAPQHIVQQLVNAAPGGSVMNPGQFELLATQGPPSGTFTGTKFGPVAGVAGMDGLISMPLLCLTARLRSPCRPLSATQNNGYRLQTLMSSVS